MDIVTAVFKDRPSAELALKNLSDIGVAGTKVSLLMSDETHAKHFKIRNETKADEGAITGAGIGGIAGTLFSLLASASVMTVPGLNLVVAGPLVAALAGLGTGALTGGLIGGLIGTGIPEYEAEVYTKAVQAGDVLLAVEVGDETQKKRVKEILEASDARDIVAA
jgi:hypothetical protein